MKFVFQASLLTLILAFAIPARAERIGCARYLLGYIGRTENIYTPSLDPWLSRLREMGLDELADLVVQGKIQVKAIDRPGGKAVTWRTTLFRQKVARGYMLILNRPAINDDSHAFWKFASDLYEIYFYRSLWGLPNDLWDNTQFSAKWFMSHAPAYFASLKRITPKMYALYSMLEESERLKLAARQISEPSALAQSARYWSAPVDNRLNLRDLRTFQAGGEANLNEVLQNRLEPRVIVGHYAGYARKYFLIMAVFGAVMNVCDLPDYISSSIDFGQTSVRAVNHAQQHPEEVRANVLSHSEQIFRRDIARRNYLRDLPKPTAEQRQELEDLEDEIEAAKGDNPNLVE